jgi:uncharacterized lipoprotein YbaY
MPDTVRVHGRVRMAPGLAVTAQAVLRISLLDVTEVDRAAVVVAEQRIAGGELEAQRDSVGFELHAAVDPRRRYVVSAHADLDGDGSVSAGDQLSMQSYPVATFGHPLAVVVDLRPVSG